MKRVAMFVTNPCTHDARVMKEAATLSENGYEVRVFALANAFNAPGIYPQGNYTVHRLKFDNIFTRGREVTWSIASFILKPLRLLKTSVVWMYKGLVSLLLLVLKAIFASPVLILAKLFPSFAEIIRRRESLPELNSAGYASPQIEVFARWFRRSKVSFYVYLRANTSYRNRVLIQKILSKFSRILGRCLRMLVRLVRLPGKIYVKVRSKLITRINRLLYKVLLPLHKISTYYYFCMASSKAAEIWGADVAHAHDLNTMYAAYNLKRKFSSTIVVYDSHELWIHRNRVGREARLEKLIDRAVEKWLIKYADAVITVCDSIGEWLEERYPNIPKPVIVRNMPHRLIHREGDAIVGLKLRLGIPENNVVMIYTGKITSGRGIEIGVDALAKLDALQFVLLGYGEQSYVDGLKKKIVDLGVSERVTFCDPVPHAEVTNFIYGADFALVYIEPVCLSYEYALPNKLFESVQAGVPVLGSSLVEIERIVNGYEIGVCFSDASDLANKVLLECNKVQLDKWRKSINIAASELCWDKEQSKLVELYARI
jgi:glycosyltransferase involved in cell wall biosynthesis